MRRTCLAVLCVACRAFLVQPAESPIGFVDSDPIIQQSAAVRRP